MRKKFQTIRAIYADKLNFGPLVHKEHKEIRYYSLLKKIDSLKIKNLLLNLELLLKSGG